MKFAIQIAVCIALLAGVIALFELTSLDVRVQDTFYDFSSGRWLLDRNDPLLEGVFYSGAKGLVIAIGVACGVAFLCSWRVKALVAWRRASLLVALATIFVPLLVAGSKLFTNVYTPNQTVRYGGAMPYVKVLEKYPADFHPEKRGKGYPAGHATGGFALMVGYFCFERRRWKLLALAAGVAMGSIMGVYQTLNGQHYISHMFVTAIAAWMIILIINRLVPRSLGRPPAAPAT